MLFPYLSEPYPFELPYLSSPKRLLLPDMDDAVGAGEEAAAMRGPDGRPTAWP